MTKRSKDNFKFSFSARSFASVSRWLCISIIATLTLPSLAISDENSDLKISTNQTWIEDLQKGKGLKIKNVDAHLSLFFQNYQIRLKSSQQKIITISPFLQMVPFTQEIYV